MLESVQPLKCPGATIVWHVWDLKLKVRALSVGTRGSLLYGAGCCISNAADFYSEVNLVRIPTALLSDFSFSPWVVPSEGSENSTIDHSRLYIQILTNDPLILPSYSTLETKLLNTRRISFLYGAAGQRGTQPLDFQVDDSFCRYLIATLEEELPCSKADQLVSTPASY